MKNYQEQALEDISLIKNIIFKTRNSFTSTANFFIATAVIWFLSGVALASVSFYSLLEINQTMSLKNNNIIILNVIIIALTILMQSIICIRMRKSHTMSNDLSRKLIDTWSIALLGAQILTIFITNKASMGYDYSEPLTNITTLLTVISPYPMFIIISSVVAIMLFVTGFFTENAFPCILSLVYLGLTLISMNLKPVILFKNNLSLALDYGDIIGYLLIPTVFLILGLYLKRQSKNSTKDVLG